MIGLSDFWLGFLCGDTIGVFVGFILAAMLRVASVDDRVKARMLHRYREDSKG